MKNETETTTPRQNAPELAETVQNAPEPAETKQNAPEALTSEKLKEASERIVAELEKSYATPNSCFMLAHAFVMQDAFHSLAGARKAQQWEIFKALNFTVRALALYFLARQGEKDPALLVYNLTRQARQEAAAIARAEEQKETT